MLVGSKTWHGRKKGKVRIKTFSEKLERNLNEGKFGLRSSFEKERNKGLYHQALQSMRVSDRENNLRFMIT